MNRVRVFLIDDQKLIRTGVRKILEDEEDIDVVGEASSGEEALRLVRDLKPDVVLMDIHMPGMGGLETTRQLASLDPRPRIIGLSVSGQEPYPSHLFAVGAQGYLSKDCAADEVIEAVWAVMDGERYLSRDVAQDYALTHADPASGQANLSCRETEILVLLCEGRNAKDIAETLHISPSTVRTYRHRLYAKLNVHSPIELIREVWLQGLIPGQVGPEHSRDS
ncbi:MAG: response regulator [Gammaproteobacteria bacterium]